jgi:cell division protein FtsQ
VASRRRKGATRNNSAPQPRLPLRWVVSVFLLAGLVGALYLGTQRLLDPQTLPVRSVRVESPLRQVSQQQLREVVGAHVQEGFLRLDVERVRAELEALPWVRRASVRHAWPDVVVVQLEEQQAVARWGSDGLLNREGELFSPGQDQAAATLPLLRGPQDTHKQVAMEFSRMQEMLTPLGLQISHLTLNERRAWSLRVSNGLQLGLGRNDVHLRLLRFVRTYAEVIKPRLEAIDSVDLRYTNGFAVRWHNGNAPAA